MNFQYTPFLIPLAIAAGVSIELARYAWRRRTVPGMGSLTLFLLAAAEWSMGYALELGSIGLETKLFWAKMQYLGIVTVAGTILVMIIQYTGHEKWLTPGRLALLAIAPIITLLLVWTNEAHYWIWAEVKVVNYSSYSVLQIEHGKGFWLIVVYSYLCLHLGMIPLFLTFRRSPSVYRAQAIVIFAGMLMPWIANALYIFDLSPFPHFDLTPFAFTLTGLAATWGLLRFQLLDVVPVARDAVIEHMRDGLIVLDGQNRIVDVNPSGENMLGLSAAELIGMPATQVFSTWADLVTRYKDVEDIHEEIFIDEDTSRWWFDLRISALYNRKGRWTGRLIVLRDITERKLVEQERERLIEELNAFAHTVAHDLKNPLTVINGYIQLLDPKYDTLSEENRAHYIQTIRQSASKMRDIVDALLLLASVRRRAELPIGPLDMANIVAEALQRLDAVIKEYEAEIILPDTWKPALGYNLWVEEIWVNYINNAIKYGGKPPRVELGSEAQTNGTVCFWVRDNGPGLTPEEQARLFVPFSRLDQRETEGHGLGLSIVERIVDRLGGQVRVESAPGQGSTFKFTLPILPK